MHHILIPLLTIFWMTDISLTPVCPVILEGEVHAKMNLNAILLLLYYLEFGSANVFLILSYVY